MTASPVDIEITLPKARSPRRDALPTLSVVVASTAERAALRARIESLVARCESADVEVEIVVVRAAASGELTALSRVFPSVRFVLAPRGSTIPQLRGVGMAHASGDIVTLTDDTADDDVRYLEHLVDRIEELAGPARDAQSAAR